MTATEVVNQSSDFFPTSVEHIIVQERGMKPLNNEKHIMMELRIECVTTRSIMYHDLTNRS